MAWDIDFYENEARSFAQICIYSLTGAVSRNKSFASNSFKDSAQRTGIDRGLGRVSKSLGGRSRQTASSPSQSLNFAMQADDFVAKAMEIPNLALQSGTAGVEDCLNVAPPGSCFARFDSAEAKP